MSVIASDIKIRYSTVSGSAGNSTAGTAAGSLGKYMSTTDAVGSANVFFDDVSSAEALAGDTEYRCVFVYNSHSTDSALNVAASITAEVSGGGVTTAALDNIATSAAGSSSAQAAQIANEDAVPSGVGAFSVGPLSIGTLTAGQCKAVWLKRVVGASTAAMTGDGFTFHIAGDG
jgi:hypothetical protein